MDLVTKKEKDRIDLICKRYWIDNYTINKDGTVDVDGDVDLGHFNLTKMPLVFGSVSGIFICSNNELSSLHNGPKIVGDKYICSFNQLTSLEGLAHVIGGELHCTYNFIQSLVGIPSTLSVLAIGNNPLETTYSGNIDIELERNIKWRNTKLPRALIDNVHHIKPILKYQRFYEIWNDDLTLNVNNFQILLDEINDGLE